MMIDDDGAGGARHASGAELQPLTDDPAAAPAADEGWAVYSVPRVVLQTEPTVAWSPGGTTPRMSAHTVSVTVWAEFGPIDYVRYLQRWAATMPSGVRDRGIAAVVILLIGVLVAVAGGQAGAPAIGWVGVGCAVLGLLVGMSWLRHRKPNVADGIWIALASANAIDDYNRGRHGMAAVNTAFAGSYALRIHQRGVHDGAQREDDAAFWWHAETQPLSYQWEAATWFRNALAQEYARRTHGAVPADQAPVPRYVEVARYLYDNPQAW